MEILINIICPMELRGLSEIFPIESSGQYPGTKWVLASVVIIIHSLAVQMGKLRPEGKGGPGSHPQVKQSWTRAPESPDATTNSDVRLFRSGLEVSHGVSGAANGAAWWEDSNPLILGGWSRG